MAYDSKNEINERIVTVTEYDKFQDICWTWQKIPTRIYHSGVNFDFTLVRTQSAGEDIRDSLSLFVKAISIYPCYNNFGDLAYEHNLDDLKLEHTDSLKVNKIFFNHDDENIFLTSCSEPDLFYSLERRSRFLKDDEISYHETVETQFIVESHLKLKEIASANTLNIKIETIRKSVELDNWDIKDFQRDSRLFYNETFDSNVFADDFAYMIERQESLEEEKKLKRAKIDLGIGSLIFVTLLFILVLNGIG
jgi:hypothetical protein